MIIRYWINVPSGDAPYVPLRFYGLIKYGDFYWDYKTNMVFNLALTLSPSLIYKYPLWMY